MAMTDTPTTTSSDAPVLTFKRRTIDSFLISLGVVATVVLVVAGALLNWGASFSDDYVYDELSSQNITFPPAEALEAEGRDDLMKFAGVQVTTGEHAEAYASYIDGHLQETAGGMTYAELGTPERAARGALETAIADGADDATIADLQAELDEVSGQRNTLFKGETLRGLLLSAFAWSTVGQIAGYAALGAFIAAGVMAVLVVLGLRHHHKVVVMES
ncbi:hypothetical protein [Actinomarinicola tropica]|uniref:Aromatic ring-opening dioxygenase LigA n=1 Tax=Actinomarinicola tropica TaxID=2789776 RepID=A0A5Q2RT75_9ACTN|nr:hypothetical protein [Actinomarinicola tropica]QGG96415.1 hypothetical protein GH723_15630 [Actinomarinicola tropica]